MAKITEYEVEIGLAKQGNKFDAETASEQNKIL